MAKDPKPIEAVSFDGETFDPRRHETCEVCQGEGVEIVRHGMYWSDTEECYFPDEREEPCDTCKGKGYVHK